MSKGRILALIGRSSVGKSEIEKLLCKRGWSKVVSHTTRQPRIGEIDGVDYHFVSDEEYFEIDSQGEFLEKTEYRVNGEVWRYGFSKSAFDKEGNLVLIVNPKGLQDLLEYEDIRNRIIVVEIDSKLEYIIKRYMRRENDNQELDGELCKRFVERLLADSRDFSDENLEFLRNIKWEFVIENNGNDKSSLMDVVEEIENIIDYVEGFE